VLARQEEKPEGATTTPGGKEKGVNNRTEEAIGTGHDFWTAYREEAFGITQAGLTNE
jgi:hypothetical protein